MDRDAPFSGTPVRALFLSDLHLGAVACQPLAILRSLKAFSPQRIYLVGDILDLWAMQRHVTWQRPHNTVVQKLLRHARRGTQITWIAGNHDELLRDFVGLTFGDIAIAAEAVYTAANGARLLVTHGDRYDEVTRYHRWIAHLGDRGYEWLVRLNRTVSWLRRKFRRPGHWSLAGYVKSQVKQALQFIDDFERNIKNEALRRGLCGVICGHIHTPVLRLDSDGFGYFNCGDWVDNCTAIVECDDGLWQLWRFATPEAELLATLPAFSSLSPTTNAERSPLLPSPSPVVPLSSSSSVEIDTPYSLP
ncbi:MAG: UDP-2,3-diacylglucosamine diphosphatase [Hydrogenophilus sp.]|nr:UDP-2,3-diacylglucosamine diphosphatase [Hydrogenophilus sp.]